jgi:hypothetical protein
MLQRLLAPSIGILLASCSAPQHLKPVPSDAQDSARQVLVIEEAPDGQLTHSWAPASNFDLSSYPYA